MCRSIASVVPSQRSFPQASVHRSSAASRIPGGHVDSVGHVPDRHFALRPVREERLEQAPAHLPVQAADAVHRAAAVDGQIGHVEGLRIVARIRSAQRQQVGNRYAELLIRVAAEVLLDESGRETVKSGCHRRVRREQVPRSSDGQCHFERLPGFVHKAASAFQNGKRRMPFVEVTDFRLEAECPEKSPTADPEEQFLLEAQFRPAAVQLARDPAIRRDIGRVVAVQQVKLHPADLDLPGAQPDRVTGQGDLQPQATRRSTRATGVIGSCPGSLYGYNASWAPSLSMIWRK